MWKLGRSGSLPSVTSPNPAAKVTRKYPRICDDFCDNPRPPRTANSANRPSLIFSLMFYMCERSLSRYRRVGFCETIFWEPRGVSIGQALVRLLRIEWAGLRFVSVFILKSKNQPRLRWQWTPAHGRELPRTVGTAASGWREQYTKPVFSVRRDNVGNDGKSARLLISAALIA